VSLFIIILTFISILLYSILRSSEKMKDLIKEINEKKEEEKKERQEKIDNQEWKKSEIELIESLDGWVAPDPGWYEDAR